MTILDRLVRKGQLTRRKVGRTFVYAPSQSRDALRRAALRELIDGYFDGSEAELISFLRARGTPDVVPATLPVDSPGRDTLGRIDAVLL
jgi:predicted transcriptional regulator